jgi:hypothetical protein
LAIENHFTLQSPQAAAKRVRDLNGIANTIWTKYFKDHLDLKSETRGIFNHLATVYEEKFVEVESLQRKTKKSVEENKSLKNQLSETQVFTIEKFRV